MKGLFESVSGVSWSGNLAMDDRMIELADGELALTVRKTSNL